jgi:hypothetical protein
MLAWFGKHPKELNTWVNTISKNLLTNYNGSPKYSENLKDLKAKLTTILSSYSGEFQKEATVILMHLSNAEVREVD